METSNSGERLTTEVSFAVPVWFNPRILESEFNSNSSSFRLSAFGGRPQRTPRMLLDKGYYDSSFWATINQR